MGTRRPTRTQSRIAEAIRRSPDKTDAEIAQEAGCSPSYVSAWAREAGLRRSQAATAAPAVLASPPSPTAAVGGPAAAEPGTAEPGGRVEVGALDDGAFDTAIMEAVEKIAAAGALPGGPLDADLAAGLARGDDDALTAAEDDVCRRVASTGHATMLDWEADTGGGVLFCAYGTAGDAEGNTDTVDIVFGAKGCGDDEDEFIEHSCTLLVRPDPERGWVLDAAWNPCAAAEEIAAAAADPDPSRRAAAATNRACPPDVLRRLAEDPDSLVARSVLWNRACPPDARETAAAR